MLAVRSALIGRNALFAEGRRPADAIAASEADVMRITPTLMARVLKELIDSGYIRQMAGPADRRQRRLYPTLAGRELALALCEPQSRRIGRAMEGMSDGERDAVRRFLSGMQQPSNGASPEAVSEDPE